MDGSGAWPWKFLIILKMAIESRVKREVIFVHENEQKLRNKSKADIFYE